MTDPVHPETPDEAYERLVRSAHLGREIELLEQQQREMLALSRPEQALYTERLRELHRRRIAMGRIPDDELNATADLDAADKRTELETALDTRRLTDGEIGDLGRLEAPGLLTGAEFVEQAKAALGGGLVLTEEMIAGLEAETIMSPSVEGSSPGDERARCGLRLRACPYTALYRHRCSGCNYEPVKP